MQSPRRVKEIMEAVRANRPVTASCTIQGNVAEYKVFDPTLPPPPGGRGSITTFSSSARLRMLKYFQRINFADHPEPLFMTLTYPDEHAYRSIEKRNIDRKVMARHLEKLTGRHVPAAWRVEFVPRRTGFWSGVICPHWHWMIFSHEFIAWQDVRQLWAKTLGFDGYIRTEIKAVPRVQAVPMYMAKYIAKEAVPLSLVNAAYQNRIGRAYGFVRKGEIPTYPRNSHVGLTADQRAEMMRLANEQLPWLGDDREQSWTLFGPRAQDAQKILTGELLD